MTEIKTLGIAPLAASTNRADSKYYLEYKDSYVQIVKSINLYAPEQIDRVLV